MTHSSNPVKNNKIVKSIEDDYFNKKNVLDVGDVPHPNKHLYKYIKFQYAKKWLENDQIRFDEPTKWKDKFEARFYTATYKNANTNKIIDNKHTPPLYALSLSTEKKSEASWLVYSDGKIEDCVRFVFSLSKLKKVLERISNPQGMFYCGMVNYGLTNSQIIGLDQKTYLKTVKGGKITTINPLYDEVFNNSFELKNYLSLLLLKRSLFKYEEEFRFFYVPSYGNMIKDINGQSKDFMGISLKDALVRIDVQETMGSTEKKYIMNWALNNNVDYKEENLYGNNGLLTIIIGK